MQNLSKIQRTVFSEITRATLTLAFVYNSIYTCARLRFIRFLRPSIVDLRPGATQKRFFLSLGTRQDFLSTTLFSLIVFLLFYFFYFLFYIRFFFYFFFFNNIFFNIIFLSSISFFPYFFFILPSFIHTFLYTYCYIIFLNFILCFLS